MLSSREQRLSATSEIDRITKLNEEALKACQEQRQQELDAIQKEFGPGALDQAESIRQRVLTNKLTLTSGSKEERLLSQYEDLKRIPFNQRVTLPIRGEETRRRQ